MSRILKALLKTILVISIASLFMFLVNRFPYIICILMIIISIIFMFLYFYWED